MCKNSPPQKKQQHHLSTGPLQGNLHSALVTRRALRKRGEEVGDVVPRMSVQASPQPLLVKVMRNETDTPTEHEETVENAHAEVVFGLFGAEGTAVAEEVDETDGNAAVDVEDEVVLLGRSHCLDGNGVVEHLAAGEALLDELFDKLDTEIGVGT